jgi:hypothetical protein
VNVEGIGLKAEGYGEDGFISGTGSDVESKHILHIGESSPFLIRIIEPVSPIISHKLNLSYQSTGIANPAVKNFDFSNVQITKDENNFNFTSKSDAELEKTGS